MTLISTAFTPIICNKPKYSDKKQDQLKTSQAILTYALFIP